MTALPGVQRQALDPTTAGEQALALAVEYGIKVLPLAGKVPLIPKEEGGHGHLDATTDPDAIAELLARPRCTGYGIVPASGRLLGIDVDCAEDEAFLGELSAFSSETWIVRSGRAGGTGLHVYFRMPPDLEAIGNLVLRGVKDCKIRCTDGYLVGVGSVHPDTGAVYKTIQGSPGEVADLPPALEALIREKLKTRETQKASGHLPERIPKGQRNDALTAEAGRIARTARDGEEVERKLVAFNSSQCDPPTREQEVRGIAKRIVEKEKRSRAEGMKNRPRSSGPAVQWEMRSTDYPCSERHALEDFGYLLDLAGLIACNAEMLIKTGKGRSHPAWVGDGEAELAARYLENRWSWSRKKLRRKLKQWEAWDLIEVLPPIRRGRANRVRLKGWVRCDPLWGQASGASRGQPYGAYKTIPSNEVGGAPKQPKGQASGGGEGHNSTAVRDPGGRWLRLCENLEVSLPIDGAREAA